MADFDAALNRQAAFAVRRGIACDDVADVRHQVGLGQITTPVDACVVKVHHVGATNPVVHHGYVAVRHDFQSLLQLHRAQVAWLAAEVRLNLGEGGKAKAAFKTRQLADFDFVHVVVTAH